MPHHCRRQDLLGERCVLVHDSETLLHYVTQRKKDNIYLAIGTPSVRHLQLRVHQ